MAGLSRLVATDEQRDALKRLAAGSDRAEADRARAVLLTLDGWSSPRIAQAFGVREDTVRLWRSGFMRAGVDTLKTKLAPGPIPFKGAAALRVAGPLLDAPVADRTNWTLARLAAEITHREGVTISRSQLSKVLRQKGGSASDGRGTR
jgi:transposase